jgi:hypothetical protein
LTDVNATASSEVLGNHGCRSRLRKET